MKYITRVLSLTVFIIWIFIGINGASFLSTWPIPQALYGAVSFPILINNIIGAGTALGIKETGPTLAYFVGGVIAQVLYGFFVIRNLFKFYQSEKTIEATPIPPTDTSEEPGGAG